MKPLVLAAACIADALFGDPAGMPHPVRAFGAASAYAERVAFAYARGDARRELVCGAIACATIVGGTYVAARAVLVAAYRIDRRFGIAVDIALAWTTLAARDLLAEAATVDAALASGDLVLARTRVARIVGRDTDALSPSEVARAAIETLAESACDGIVAPLVALALGGTPLALAFKAASTLDSTIGHIEAPHTYYGRAAARLDDAACFVPARIAALAIAACAPIVEGTFAQSFATARADASGHASPNAGWPEAAMAGALAVRLGGCNRYGGLERDAPVMGSAFAAPGVADGARAARVVASASVLCALAAIAVSALLESRGKS